MSVVYSEDPYRKMEYIKNLAASGKSRKEIAEELGYKDTEGLRAFVRRHGHEWNAKKGLFVLKGEKIEEPEEIPDNPSGRVASVIAMFNKKMDGKEIAKSLRFGSYQEMADYMRSKGYLWNNIKRNYFKTGKVIDAEPEQDNKLEYKIKQERSFTDRETKCDCMEKYRDILRFFDMNKDKLQDIFKTVDEEHSSFKRYILPGIVITKSIKMVNTLDNLIKDYSSHRNISQKEIIEIAVVEFLKKYGYASEVKAILNI